MQEFVFLFLDDKFQIRFSTIEKHSSFGWDQWLCKHYSFELFVLTWYHSGGSINQFVVILGVSHFEGT